MAPKPNKNLEPGIAFARYVKAFAFAKGNYHEAAAYAKANWDSSTPEVELALNTAISAGTTTDSVWAGPLVYAQDFPAAFLEFLRPLTTIGRIPGMTRVPFNIRYGIQDGGSTVAWVGQGPPKPVSKLTFTSGTLGFAKAAGIVVITQELARFSSPSAELLCATIWPRRWCISSISNSLIRASRRLRMCRRPPSRMARRRYGKRQRHGRRWPT